MKRSIIFVNKIRDHITILSYTSQNEDFKKKFLATLKKYFKENPPPKSFNLRLSEIDYFENENTTYHYKFVKNDEYDRLLLYVNGIVRYMINKRVLPNITNQKSIIVSNVKTLSQPFYTIIPHITLFKLRPRKAEKLSNNEENSVFSYNKVKNIIKNNLEEIKKYFNSKCSVKGVKVDIKEIAIAQYKNEVRISFI